MENACETPLTGQSDKKPVRNRDLCTLRRDDVRRESNEYRRFVTNFSQQNSKVVHNRFTYNLSLLKSSKKNSARVSSAEMICARDYFNNTANEKKKKTHKAK